MSQLAGIEVNQRVEVAVLLERYLVAVDETAYRIARGRPAPRLGVERDARGIELLDHRRAVEAVDREIGYTFQIGRVSAHIGIRAVVDLAVYVGIVGERHVALDMLALKLHAVALRDGNDP